MTRLYDPTRRHGESTCAPRNKFGRRGLEGGALPEGTINPGIIWAGKYFQLGLEAVIPINERTGKNVGIRGQIHFFLDDLFPTTIGRPLFKW
jgi:hypothetical protein